MSRFESKNVFIYWLLSRLMISTLCLFVPLSSADGFNFETLLMPGELIKGHAELEQDCKNCHVALDKKAQDTLCLDCHKEVAQDFDNHTGFHGKQVRDPQCKLCHSDHLGRDADIVNLDPGSFNHRLTDFELTGKHLEAACESCHTTSIFREASTECVDCHKKDEPHKGVLGKDCQSCHSTQSWIQVEFDHDKTDFPLLGLHENVRCSVCHASEKYEDIATTCFSCHALSDVHAGENGKECQVCHNEEGWDLATFDHNKDTNFSLKGSHKDVICSGCHQSPLYDDAPGKACIDCHRNDDSHRGQFGKNCQSCHNSSLWSDVAFKHDRDTDFVLKGKHKTLECSLCHKGNPYQEKLEQSCVSCHKLDDVHEGQQGDQCSNCHDEQGWGKNVAFDHDLTGFPLIGLHSSAACESCHLSGKFQDTQDQCYECHRDDDSHKLTLGKNCQQCHNPNGWKFWIFDHNIQTDFILDGAHEGLVCRACHQEVSIEKIELDQRCISCHKDDDVHEGEFGQQCQKCHITESFKKLIKLGQ